MSSTIVIASPSARARPSASRWPVSSARRVAPRLALEPLMLCAACSTVWGSPSASASRSIASWRDASAANSSAIDARSSPSPSSRSRSMASRSASRSAVSSAGGDRVDFGRRRRLVERCDPADERLGERVGPDRFGQIVVHSCGEARLAIALHRGRGHRDHRRVARPRALASAKFAGRVVAVHLGHLAVHEHRVVFGVGQRLECFDPVPADHDVVTELGEELGRDQLIHDVVFDEQQTPSGRNDCWCRTRRRSRRPASTGLPSGS